MARGDVPTTSGRIDHPLVNSFVVGVGAPPKKAKAKKAAAPPADAPAPKVPAESTTTPVAKSDD